MRYGSYEVSFLVRVPTGESVADARVPASRVSLVSSFSCCRVVVVVVRPLRPSSLSRSRRPRAVDKRVHRERGASRGISGWLAVARHERVRHAREG